MGHLRGNPGTSLSQDTTVVICVPGKGSDNLSVLLHKSRRPGAFWGGNIYEVSTISMNQPDCHLANHNSMVSESYAAWWTMRI